MTDPSQMPRWAADILRSTCESAAATLAAHGHLDADAARETLFERYYEGLSRFFRSKV